MMMRRVVVCLVVSALCLVVACSSKAIFIDRVLVYNGTNGPVADVKVTHMPSRKFGAVNGILPGESLDFGLAKEGVQLLAREAVVQWREENGDVRSVTLDIPKDSNAPPGRLHQLVYILSPGGQATVKIAAQ